MVGGNAAVIRNSYLRTRKESWHDGEKNREESHKENGK